MPNEVVVQSTSSPIALIEMAVQQGADPENLSRLMDLQDRWEAKQSKVKFDEAICGFQRDCPPIVKKKSVNLGGGGYNYAPYEDVMHAIRPHLANHGLSLAFDSTIAEGGLLETTCRVSAFGHTESSSVTLPLPSQMRVNDTQKGGAGLSYGKRYALTNALNLVVVGEDSDAAVLAEGTITEAQFDEMIEMLDKVEANEPGTTDKFNGWLKQATGTTALRDLPSRHHSMVHTTLRSKVAEVGE